MGNLNLIAAVGCVLVVVLLAGCGHKTVLAADTATVGDAAQGASMQVAWVKNKEHAVDVQAKFVNNSSQAIFFKNKSFMMELGGEKRGLKNPNFAFELSAGQSTDQILIFDFGPTKPKMGTAILTVIATNIDGGAELAPLKIKLPLDKK